MVSFLPLINDSLIGVLLKVYCVYYKRITQNGILLGKCLKNLCRKFEVFVLEVRMKCNHVIQQQFLYMSLNIIPLGLFKCAITWFSVHLSKGESRFILYSLWNKAGIFFCKYIICIVLHSWFRTSYL